MKLLKILFLSSIFMFSNCSLINDKLISRKSKNQEVANAEKGETKEEELVMERVFIEDDKNEGLKGDEDYEKNTDYPNLANVPDRPDPSISIEEQSNILKELENNSRLEAVPSEQIYENEVANIEENFNDTTSGSTINKDRDTVYSIRDIQNAKLKEIQNFKPELQNKNDEFVTSEEEELHQLARELKNIKTQDQIIKVEEKIKKNDLYYTPSDIEKILGLTSNTNTSTSEPKKDKIEKKNISENIDPVETIITSKKIEERDVPLARITFNHGSSRLTNEDLTKIKNVANLFYENKGKKIVIVGHASSRTNYDMELTKHALVNFNISLERARRVMDEFSVLGFQSQKIELVAMSDAKPLYEEIMPSLEAANRRAEIFIEY